MGGGGEGEGQMNSPLAVASLIHVKLLHSFKI